MHKRAITVMVLAAMLALLADTAWAGKGAGQTTLEVSASRSGVAAAVKTVRGSLHQQQARRKAARLLSRKLHRLQQTTWQMERVMNQPLNRPSRQLAASGLPGLVSQVRLWRRLERRAWQHYHHPPHLAELLCIHSGIKGGKWSISLEYLGGGTTVSHGEGSWTDHGPMFFGGLQMNRGFQGSYGPELFRTKGTADKWTAFEQLWTAEQAIKAKGFAPWPQTGPACGVH